jgi:hypothetical protein
MRKLRKAWDRPSIVVVREKHSTTYLDATTEEAFHRSCRELLRRRFEEGYWYPPLSELYGDEPRVDLDPAAVAQMPPSSQHRMAHARQIRELAEWQSGAREYDDSFSSGTTRQPRTVRSS